MHAAPQAGSGVYSQGLYDGSDHARSAPKFKLLGSLASASAPVRRSARGRLVWLEGVEGAKVRRGRRCALPSAVMFIIVALKH